MSENSNDTRRQALGETMPDVEVSINKRNQDLPSASEDEQPAVWGESDPAAEFFVNCRTWFEKHNSEPANSRRSA